MLKTTVACVAAAAALAAMPAAAAGPGQAERAKIDRFAADLRAERDRLGRADADLAKAMRAAFQQGSQDSARAALGRYAGALQSLLSAGGPPPRLGGCYARARPALVEARGLATAALNNRRTRVAALAGITYRPLTLPDFGSVVIGPQAAEKESGAIAADLAKADAAATACQTQEKRDASSRRP
jgi:hypothetical protein